MDLKLDQNTKEIVDALDIILEDLTEEQKNKLSNIGKMVRNPHNMSSNEAVKIVKELGIDIEAMQKKARRIHAAMQPPRRKRIKRNAPCPCGSNKKYKKCCWDNQEPEQK